MPRAQAVTVQAPTKGWNTRDALSGMDPQFAPVLENWWPTNGRVELRKGYTTWESASFAASVESLMVFDDGANPKLFAAADGNIYDITTKDSPSSEGTGYSNNRWAHATLNGVMGMVNGSEKVQWSSGSIAPLAYTGLTGNAIGIQVYKGRSYFWVDNDQSVWYSSVGTMGATLAEFDFGNLDGSINGELVAMEAWTLDGGAGMDDLAVFIFSGGDILVYSGSDPGGLDSGSSFSRVGHYRIAPPIGRRCAMQFRGDIVVITTDGYVSLQEVIRGRKPSISNVIANTVQADASQYGSRFGWQSVFFPNEQMMVFNVPTDDDVAHQHVINTLTGAWTRFAGWDASCFAVFQDQLFFGGNGAVYKAWDGKMDGSDFIGCDAVPGFVELGKGRRSRVSAVRPGIRATSGLQLEIIGEVDLIVAPKPAFTSTTGTGLTPWGSAWGSSWGGADTAVQLNTTRPLAKTGRHHAARICASTKNHILEWYDTTYMFEVGGFI